MTTSPDDVPGRSGEMVQYLIHPVIRPRIDAWLESQGLSVGRIPSSPDDLPTYAIVPGEELRAAVENPRTIWKPTPLPGEPDRVIPVDPDARISRPFNPEGHNGVCTTCGKPAHPHPMRHPVTGIHP